MIRCADCKLTWVRHTWSTLNERSVDADYRGYRETRFFGSLDGLRAISIVGVIWFHCWFETHTGGAGAGTERAATHDGAGLTADGDVSIVRSTSAGSGTLSA